MKNCKNHQNFRLIIIFVLNLFRTFNNVKWPRARTGELIIELTSLERNKILVKPICKIFLKLSNLFLILNISWQSKFRTTKNLNNAR